jgi:hypothetical protein
MEASEQTVQEFCRSVPECSRGKDDRARYDCFRRCEDHQCEDYGQVCHHSHVCLSPPVMLDHEDDQEDDYDE